MACGDIPHDIHYPVFTILTKDAVGEMRSIHDRMPVILRKDWIGEWLSPDCEPMRIVKRSLHDLVIERASG